jgi:hypothetical protein
MTTTRPAETPPPPGREGWRQGAGGSGAASAPQDGRQNETVGQLAAVAPPSGPPIKPRRVWREQVRRNSPPDVRPPATRPATRPAARRRAVQRPAAQPPAGQPPAGRRLEGPSAAAQRPACGRAYCCPRPGRGLSALDSPGQFLAWALVFGAAQQLVTGLVDKKAQSVLDPVGSAPMTEQK